MEVRYPAAEPYETGMLDAGDGNPGAGEAASGGDLIATYGRLMADSGPAVRARAAAGWPAWEDATISLDPDGSPGAYSARPADLLLARTWPGAEPTVIERSGHGGNAEMAARQVKALDGFAAR